MGAWHYKKGNCRLRSCKYHHADGICGYSYVTEHTRTRILMDMYELPANSPELRELLASHPCPLYEHK